MTKKKTDSQPEFDKAKSYPAEEAIKLIDDAFTEAGIYDANRG